jgi:hypothetical protein
MNCIVEERTTFDKVVKWLAMVISILESPLSLLVVPGKEERRAKADLLPDLEIPAPVCSTTSSHSITPLLLRRPFSPSKPLPQISRQIRTCCTARTLNLCSLSFFDILRSPTTRMPSLALQGLLTDLTRDFHGEQHGQSVDVLQYCADWFQAKLRAEASLSHHQAWMNPSPELSLTLPLVLSLIACDCPASNIDHGCTYYSPGIAPKIPQLSDYESPADSSKRFPDPPLSAIAVL